MSVQWDTTGHTTLEDHWSHKYTGMPLEPHWLTLAPSDVPMAIQCWIAWLEHTGIPLEVHWKPLKAHWKHTDNQQFFRCHLESNLSKHAGSLSVTTEACTSPHHTCQVCVARRPESPLELSALCWLQFYCKLFPNIQLEYQHWFRWRFDTNLSTNHRQNHWWPSLPMHIIVTRSC